MASETIIPQWLLILGFTGQAAFGARFIIQWISSEIRKESHVPLVFWYFSLIGGILLLIYAIGRRDWVFIVGQGMGLVVYVRNLALIADNKKRAAC